MLILGEGIEGDINRWRCKIHGRVMSEAHVDFAPEVRNWSCHRSNTHEMCTNVGAYNFIKKLRNLFSVDTFSFTLAVCRKLSKYSGGILEGKINYHNHAHQ